MDKIQSSQFVKGMDQLPRGGYLSPETYLVKVKLPGGKEALGIATNEENIGDFGQPDVGDKVKVWVDDGMGGAKQVDATVSGVVGEFEEGALNSYSATFHALLGNNKINLPFKDFLGLLQKQAASDGVISAQEAVDSVGTLVAMDRKNAVKIHQIQPPSGFKYEAWLEEGQKLLEEGPRDPQTLAAHLRKLYQGVHTPEEARQAIVEWLSYEPSDPQTKHEIVSALTQMLDHAFRSPSLLGGLAPTVLLDWLYQDGSAGAQARADELTANLEALEPQETEPSETEKLPLSVDQVVDQVMDQVIEFSNTIDEVFPEGDPEEDDGENSVPDMTALMSDTEDWSELPPED